MEDTFSLRVGKLCLVISAVSMTLFQFYTAATVPLRSTMQASAHFTFALLVSVLSDILSGKRRHSVGILILDWLMIACSLAFNLRILIAYGEIDPVASAYLSMFDKFLACAAIIVTIEMCRRATGLIMPLVALAFVLYPFIGPYLPQFLYHPGFTLNRTLSVLYFSTSGIYGVALQISAIEIFPLVLFGSFVFSFGGGDLLLDISKYLFGRTRGGIAKVAVLASCLFGMLSGSGPANAASIGMFTIPMMKRSGYPPVFAAATEAAAGVGGQIMPPVMGAAAFIMANLLGIRYGDLIVYAFPIALLYYLSIYVSVDIEAQRLSLRGLKEDEIPKVGPRLKRQWPILLSLVALIYFLVMEQFGAGSSAFWATIILFATQFIMTLCKKAEMSYQKIIDACVSGVKSASMIAITCAAAGLILGIVDFSGLAVRVTSSLLSIAENHLVLSLLMAAVGSLVLGTALPTVACYVIVAVLAVPSLIEMGINPVAAHMFAFYFGIISNLTPPVAVTAYVAAGIAESDPIKTGFTATRITVGGFIAAFLMALHPSLVLQGPALDFIGNLFRAVALIVCANLACGGWVFGRKLSFFLRVIIGAAVAGTIVQNATVNLAGYVVLACFGAWLVWTGYKRRQMKKDGVRAVGVIQADE